MNKLRNFAIIGVLAVIMLACCSFVRAQAPTPTPDRNAPVTVSQGFVDDATKAFTLVVELRDALQKAQIAAGADTVLKAALQTQINDLNDLEKIRDRKEAIYESIIELDKKAFAVYDTIIKIISDQRDKALAQLDKPKSAFQKLIGILKDALLIAAGVTFGRGL